MKRILSIALAMGLTAVCAQAQSWKNNDKVPAKTKGWIEDFEKAKAEAETFKQPIFAFFTGGDWCGWCKLLKQEVLDTKEFAAFAADNLILFEADFPRSKKLSDKVMKQNTELASKYSVNGYPTVILLDAEGKSIGKTGYKEGGDKAYITHLKELLAKAGIETETKAEAAKALSPYEKAKAEKEAAKDK
ncbi:MAG: thioredoxin family protein [Kiritimatiellaeota bacterium]|nr:thioredoxin family protein [Kiritimatiellota bacterium]